MSFCTNVTIPPSLQTISYLYRPIEDYNTITLYHRVSPPAGGAPPVALLHGHGARGSAAGHRLRQSTHRRGHAQTPALPGHGQAQDAHGGHGQLLQGQLHGDVAWPKIKEIKAFFMNSKNPKEIKLFLKLAKKTKIGSPG